MSTFLHSLESDDFEAALGENLRMLTEDEVPESMHARPSILCLGESHGSHLFALSRNVLPGTGGLLIDLPTEVGFSILLDPGWGTIAAAHRLHRSLKRVDLILVSHCHLDHVGDLHPCIITLSLLGRRPVLIGNSTALKGSAGQPSVLPTYFRNLCDRVIVARSNRPIRARGIEVLPFGTGHVENPGTSGKSLSYIISLPGEEGVSIGLLTDGPFGEIPETVMTRLRKCQVMVINIGTCSTQQHTPSHSKVFDNALCLHGLRAFLGRLAEDSYKLSSLGITHLGAELLEVRSPLMKDFLAKTKCMSPIELIRPAIVDMIDECMDKAVEVKILREGDSLEV